MPDAKESTAQEIMEAVIELREEFENKTIDVDKIKNIEAFLDEQEKKNQELLVEKKQLEARESETKDRIDVLEVELARSNGPGDKKNYKESKEYKAINNYCRVGPDNIDSEQKALLRTDSDVDGGFLTTTEMDSEITKKIIEISNIRLAARVRGISSKALELPVRDTLLRATYEGEAEEDDESTSTYSSETLNTFRQSVTVPVTMDMLQDAQFDMESEIMGDAILAFSEDEGKNFVVGDGVKKPSGFVSDIRVQDDAFDSESSSTVTASDVISLTGELKTGYNPMYFFNRRTLAFLRTLKSVDGQFLWQPGLNGPVATTLNGFDYLLAEDMPIIADNAFPIAFADLKRGYTIVDRTGTSVIRDNFTKKRKATIEFTFTRWNYGQVTLPEAIKLLKVIP